MKKSKRRKLTDKLDELCKDIIRERDDWTCQCCGKKVAGKNAQASHVKPKSLGLRFRWDLLNMKLLCGKCHLSWHGDPTGSDWFTKKWPHRMEYIESIPRGPVIWKNDKLEEMIAEYKQKLKELEINNGPT